MKNLREFVEILERKKLLARIQCEVDLNEEIAEIHRRVIEGEGPALLFERVRGSRFPVVTNLFGTLERVKLAFEEDSIQFLEQAVHMAQTFFPPTPGKVWSAAKLVPRMLHAGTKASRGARVTEVRMTPTNLHALPLTKSWPEDGGHFLTLPLVYTEHPEGKGHNLGIYRMQRFDKKTLGMHWQIQKGGGFHYQEAEKLNRALPVTIHLGGHPALLLSAIAPLPENVGELLLAGFLAKRRVRMTRVARHALPIAADCEFALLGHVPPKERRLEGPFGDHYGYYSLAHNYPVFHCQEVWHARDAIFPATVVGKPRQEDFFLGEYLQRLLRPIFPLVMPQVLDLWSYGETGFHALAAAVVQERYHREAMVSAFRILGEGQLSLTKFLLVTDQRMDLTQFPQVLEHILARADFRRDLYVFNHLSMDTLDYAGPEVNKGSKGVLLGLGEAVRVLRQEFHGRLPSEVRAAKPFCGGCLVVEGPTYTSDPEAAQRIAAHPDFSEWPLVILVDDMKKTLASTITFLWTTFTRFEPAADLHAAKVTLSGHHPQYTMPVVLDARMKPKYPKELFPRQDVIKKVDRRWREYFPSS